jgi:hypothetical protein
MGIYQINFVLPLTIPPGLDLPFSLPQAPIESEPSGDLPPIIGFFAVEPLTCARGSALIRAYLTLRQFETGLYVPFV